MHGNKARCHIYLPELLGCILASDALQDLCASGVLVHELGNIVYAVVDDDVQALFGVIVGGHVGRSK